VWDLDAHEKESLAGAGDTAAATLRRAVLLNETTLTTQYELFEIGEA
jgi:hypothetical protein